MYDIGDKVQAYDGRIGTVIDAETNANAAIANYQNIVVKFPDGSMMEGNAEQFTAVFEKPFAKVPSRFDK
jgi:phage tail protein X